MSLLLCASRTSLGLLLLVLCACAAAHPYPYPDHSRSRRASSRADRTHPARRAAELPAPHHHHHQHSHPNRYRPPPVQPAPNDSHLSPHLRVSHSPYPATAGSGRTLPSSAFYALRFTIPKNSSKNRTSTAHAADHSSSADTVPQNSRNHSQSSLQHAANRTVPHLPGANATSPAHTNRSDSDERGASLRERAVGILGALRFSRLQTLFSSLASTKSRTTSPTPKKLERGVKFALPSNNVSVTLSDEVTLSDILAVLLNVAQNESDAVTEATDPRNHTQSLGNESQQLVQAQSSSQHTDAVESSEHSASNARANITEHSETGESLHNPGIIATNITVMTYKFTNNKTLSHNMTAHAQHQPPKKEGQAIAAHIASVHDARNGSNVPADKLPAAAYEIIYKLNALVHLLNETDPEEANVSQSANFESRPIRDKQSDELVHLVKRYVVKLHRAMILDGEEAKHSRKRSTVLAPLTTNARFFEEEGGFEEENSEDAESGHDSPYYSWIPKQDASAQATPSPSPQTSTTGASEEVRPGSEDVSDTVPNDANASPSATEAASTPGPTASIAMSSNEDADDDMIGEAETTASAFQPALPSPSSTPSLEAVDPSTSESEAGEEISTPTSTPTPSATPTAQAISSPPMAVPMSAETDKATSAEKNYGVREGENMTQLADMVYKLVREEEVFSIAAAPCDEVTDWMPDVMRRLQHDLVELQFYCIDTRRPAQDLSPLKRVFGDVATDFIQIGADNIRDSIPAELDMVISWKGLQRWGMERGWHFLRGLRDSGTKFVLVSNNPGIVNMEENEGVVNVRNSPLLFGEPRRVIGGVTRDNSMQLLLYAMDDIRDGF